jgi:peptide/nickel transport system substrate-binding protein
MAAAGLTLTLALCGTAMAQKQGGTLRIYHRDSPASMSIHEEGTVGVMLPMMPVFNNLMLFDQHVAQNSMQSIVPSSPPLDVERGRHRTDPQIARRSQMA